MIPVQPTALFPRPFADNGTWQMIPDNKATAGRASFKEGFPLETQQPLADGGVAPSRPDFNGILHMLSAFAFWQQSGGQWTWKNSLNYIPPCIVYSGGKLWWCLAANGPDTAVVAPGGNDDVWRNFSRFLAEAAGGGSSILGNPPGAIILYYGTAAPEGYLPCDGSAFSAVSYPRLYALLGKATTPDMRGLFVRGYDTRDSVDPDGASRSVGSVQNDAIRNITGTFDIDDNMLENLGGAFFPLSSGGKGLRADGDRVGWKAGFDASRVVPVASENRPVNITLLYCIKHD